MARRGTASPTRTGRTSTANTETPRRGTRRTSREAQNNPRPTPGRARGAAAQIDAEQDTAAAAIAQLISGDRDLADVPEEGGEETTFGVLNDVAGRSRNSTFARQMAMSPGASVNSAPNTTFSQAEVSNLNADDVINNLENLDTITEEILNVVTPEQGNQEVLQSHTNSMLNVTDRFYKRINAKFNIFSSAQSLFGSQAFIKPEHVIRRLLRFPEDTDLLSSAWLPDEILFKANLVTLLRLTFDGETSNRKWDTATTLDAQFPGFSTRTLVYPDAFRNLVGESKICEDTWVTAIDIRTQAYILGLEDGAIEGPLLETPEVVFLANSGDPSIDLGNGTYMRPFDVALTSQGDAEFQQLYLDRLLEIKGILQHHSDRESAVKALKEEFPWGSMCFTLIQWTQARYIELRQMIQSRGGVERIVESLQSEVDALEASTDPRLRESQNGTPRTQPVSYVSASNIAALKARRQRLNIQGSPSSQPSQTPNRSAQIMAQQAGAHLQENDDAEVARQLKSLASRRFIDQQHGAQRLSFADTQDSQAPQSSRAFNLPSSRKRPAEDDADFDPSQDEGFQTDPRVHTVPVRPPRAVMSTGTNPRNTLPRTSLGGQLAEAAAGTPRERQNPGRAMGSFPEARLDEDGLPVATQHQQYLQANFIAKQRTAQLMKPARARTKFSQEEEERVLELIGELGVQFAAIKKMDQESDNILGNRTAEDIRFKARNMKLDFLKAGVALPPGFEFVRIDRKGQIQLQNLGIEYDQEPMRSTNQLV